MPLKYLYKYLYLYFEITRKPLINCKVELKLKWTKYCVLSAAGNENPVDNDNNHNANKIIFAIKDTKLYVPVVTFTTRDNQKLSELLSF